ncbi:unnamed protein product [Bursaphelenchus okinawaensis]|uniref:Uncharacterized protein n=1 Tax=Bursaphelenchus okinawaensis TaxID=465554 RepID=A0A811LQ72_9BILA|nr:unnamed protein product [Bursaphelenchus okinawaensis]CAG9125507.1 unnamed protein product [Bursaphelenchus okinawaensis]
MVYVLLPVQSKPTNQMTRIQEVFRTLMGRKPMMLASRGKKSGFQNPSSEEDEYNMRVFWLLNQMNLIQPEDKK